MIMTHDSPHPASAGSADRNGLELTPLSQPGALTAMDRFIFESWGYLIIPDVLSAAECGEALEAAKRASFNLTDQSELGMGNMALIPGSHTCTTVRCVSQLGAAGGRNAR